MPSQRPKLLILVVAYNAETTIREVVRAIPRSLDSYRTEILIIDDSSADSTFSHAFQLERSGESPFPLTVLYNPVNQGYGGNQKIGYRYAIDNGFEIVALLHGDGQYRPECLPDLLQPVADGSVDAVFGSRMMIPGAARKGGMPLYKYLGNKILTFLQNRLLHSSLSEFHSGYRVYSTRALSRIPFELNANGFHFDTEIIIQLFRAGLRIKELPIPTYYGKEICYVNGIRYAWDVMCATLVSRIQNLGICYERKFDLRNIDGSNPLYQPKFNFESPHSLTLERVPAGARVADIGCASGYISQALSTKGCHVTGLDQFQPDSNAGREHFIQVDLNAGDFPLDAGEFDYILLLDVIEHLRSPERFLDSLRAARVTGREVRIIVSTGNIGFAATRLALLFGWFHYGPRGILDLTHTRLFTFATARALFEQAGYQVEELRGIPAPFPLAFGENSALAKVALAINKALIRVWKSLFAYQIFMVCTPLPSVQWLLGQAHATRRERARRAG